MNRDWFLIFLLLSQHWLATSPNSTGLTHTAMACMWGVAGVAMWVHEWRNA